MKLRGKLKFRHFVGKLSLKKPHLFPFAYRVRDAISFTLRPYRSDWGVKECPICGYENVWHYTDRGTRMADCGACAFYWVVGEELLTTAVERAITE